MKLYEFIDISEQQGKDPTNMSTSAVLSAIGRPGAILNKFPEIENVARIVRTQVDMKWWRLNK